MLNSDPLGRFWVSKGFWERKDYLVLHWLQMKMELTHDEQMVCMLAAVKLTAESNKGMDNPQRYQKSLATFDYLVESAEAIGSEWVVAKYFNLPFDPYENKFKVKADVGNAIEVRWTKYVAGQLIIHEYDRPNDIAVLVTGQAPHYFIAGWIPIAMAQRPKYRHSKQPNWWVTQINLQPIENLRRSTYGHSAI